MLGRECLHPSTAMVQEKASSEAFTEGKGQGLCKARMGLWDGVGIGDLGSHLPIGGPLN